MTQDERNMLADLAKKISQTPPPPVDAEAQDFIRKNIGARPDALYLMTQTVLIQDMALQQAQHQIQELQQRTAQPVVTGTAPEGGGFLGRQNPQYAQNPQYQAPPPQYSQQQPYSAPQYSGPQVAPPPSAMSGFLRGAAQTAAGLAVGTIAIQGIESLFSHHSGFGGGGFGGNGLFGGGGIGGYGTGETVIENNYYGDEKGGEHAHSAVADDLGPRDSFADNTQDQDTSNDDRNALGDDSNYTDDTGSDNSGGDDFS